MADEFQNFENGPVKTPLSPCLCAIVRKAGRILTRQYEECLKPSGLKVSQFIMMKNIAKNPRVSVSELAKLLVMDQSTVTRNLRVLKKLGYVHMEPEVTDQRIKRIRVTDIGISKMNEATPLWETVQMEMERVLGRKHIEALLVSLRKISE
jgi:DNA-binding MarR family transcriptional regulator